MLNTEAISPRFQGLDIWDSEEILTALWEGQMSAIASVRQAIPNLAAAAEDAAERLRERGRLVYVGAGASGHLAIQDGLEMPQTFGWPPERLVLIMAGGERARLSPLGQAEDDAEAGFADINVRSINSDDVVVGVAASGTTRYTVNALEVARKLGALTVALANNPDTPLLAAADHAILLPTGAEVIAGSTRMGAGTAQKAALNMFSTLLMTRLGHVHDGLMVDVVIDNDKLVGRGVQMLSHITGAEAEQSRQALEQNHNNLKVAALVLSGCDSTQAETVLQSAKGVLRKALARCDAAKLGETGY